MNNDELKIELEVLKRQKVDWKRKLKNWRKK